MHSAYGIEHSLKKRATTRRDAIMRLLITRFALAEALGASSGATTVTGRDTQGRCHEHRRTHTTRVYFCGGGHHTMPHAVHQWTHLTTELLQASLSNKWDRLVRAGRGKDLRV